MKANAHATIGLMFYAWLLGPALLDAQTSSPRGSPGNGGSAQACQAPRASFQRVLASADSVFAGVGSQAAILRDGELVVTVENGWSDLEHQVPVTADTRFQVASVTKAFTGMALLNLWEEGLIDLDRQVQKYVPTFPRKQGVITPRLLAAHLGGIRHYEEEERTPNFLFTHYDRVTEALMLFAQDPLAAAPGTRFIYSSYGYNLLAAAISGASGVEFTEYVRRVIIEPLGLTRTQFDNALRPLMGARGGTRITTRGIPDRPIRFSFVSPPSITVTMLAVATYCPRLAIWFISDGPPSAPDSWNRNLSLCCPSRYGRSSRAGASAG